MKRICLFFTLLVCGLSISAFASNIETQYQQDSLDWVALNEARAQYIVMDNAAGAQAFIRARISSHKSVQLCFSRVLTTDNTTVDSRLLFKNCETCKKQEIRLMKNYLDIEGRIVLSADEVMEMPEKPQVGPSNADVIRAIQKCESNGRKDHVTMIGFEIVALIIFFIIWALSKIKVGPKQK